MIDKTKLPDVLELDFIICDNTVNRYGWRLLVEGIDTVGFLKNPVACLQHNTWSVPVGKWKNLRIENSELKGTCEFDKNDDEAVKLYLKYKDGYMSAVSLNVIPIEESDDARFLIAGQKYPTLTKSELLEVSLVTIPGQKNAVRLSHPDGTEYKLSLVEKPNNLRKMTGEKTVEELQSELAKSKALNCENLIALHKQRGVINEIEVEHLKKLAALDYDTTKAMLESRTAPKETASTESADKARVLALVKLHFDRGAISAPEMKMYELSADQDFEGTKKLLEAKQGKAAIESFTQGLGAQNGGTDERKNWTYLDWYKKDHAALMLMQEKEPEAYAKLELAYVEANKASGFVY